MSSIGSDMAAQSTCLQKGLLFLVWLPRGFKAKEHILTHLTCFSLCLSKPAVCFINQCLERLVSVSLSPRASSSLSNQIKSNSSMYKTKVQALDPW